MSERAPPLHLVRPDIRALRGYTPGEQVNDCIKLNTNESAREPSARVLRAIAAIAPRDLQRYPDPQAQTLRTVAARHYGVDAEAIVAGNGSDDCLTILYRTHCRPGDRVVSPWPSYGLYHTLAGLQGVHMQRLPFADSGPGGAWCLPADLATADARMILIANPNNPSGTRCPVDELRALADAAPDRIVVVDEAYVDFAPAGSSLLPHLDAHRNLVVLRTFSKSYSLAGARLGLLFAHPSLCAEYRKVKDSYNVNVVTQAAGIAALEDQEHLAALVRATLAERDRLAAAGDRFGWRRAPSAANFLLFDVGPEADDLAAALKRRGILVRHWNSPELRDRLRITVGTPTENDALLAALDELVPR